MRVPKRKLIIIILVLLLVAASTVGYFLLNNSSDTTQQRGTKPTSTAQANFLLDDVFYDCSRPIEGTWIEASIGPLAESGYYFQPSNQEEFRKYCRSDSAIEYRAVLDILRKEDVSEAIGKYSTVEAWVKALGHKYIHDTAYLSRILPAYADMKIDCIIVVHTPESTRFFIENGEQHESHDDHQYLEVPASEFLSSLNEAPDSDITAFRLGLH